MIVETDVCVIGSGASGALAAYLASRAGRDVVVVERGARVDGRTFDEVMAESEPAFARDSKGTWHLTGYPWTASCVGGGTMFYGGASFRYRDVDFDASPHLGDGDLEVSWPYTLGDLEPYYELVERIAKVTPSQSSSAQYRPHSIPVSGTGSILAAAGETLGWRPLRTPLAISEACRADAPCMDRLCPHGAKFSAGRTLLAPAIAAGANLLSNTLAIRLERDTVPDRVDSLNAQNLITGEEISVRAESFVLAGSAIQSAAVLLRSTDRWASEGLGNAHGLVGRGLCFKLSLNIEGFLPHRPASHPPGSSAGPFSTVAFFDSYVDSDAPAGLGGLIYENRHPQRIPMADPSQIMQVECLLADQPVRDNRITLSSQRAPSGVPYLNIDYRTHPRDAARLDWLASRAEELLVASGARHVRRIETGFEQGSGHLHGTIRGGADASRGVCDKDGRLFEASNVYVADGSFFPFPGGVNPTLTILAHSARTICRSVLGQDYQWIKSVAYELGGS